MQGETDIGTLRRLQSKGALFILFGGASCSVCKHLRPQLDLMLKEHFPGVRGVYVDCEVSPEICAAYGVFSLPVVKVFIEDKMVAEEAGVFGIGQLRQALDRPYSVWRAP